MKHGLEYAKGGVVSKYAKGGPVQRKFRIAPHPRSAAVVAPQQAIQASDTLPENANIQAMARGGPVNIHGMPIHQMMSMHQQKAMR